MLVFEGQCGQDLYRTQLVAILEQGKRIHVHGRETFELLDVATVITNPKQRMMCVPGRIWNPWIAMSECLYLIAGRNDVDSLVAYNSNIGQFSDDGKTFYGAYGRRIAGQIPALIDRLRTEQNDRRAVLSIWNPEDLVARTLDPPCNDMLLFKIRDQKLHMTVVNRSNDIHWGLYAVNIPQFSFLLEALACQLDVGVGTQTHFSNSLHLYLDGPAVEITNRMWKYLSETKPSVPYVQFPQVLAHPDWESLRRDCAATLDGGVVSHDQFFEFAREYLRLWRDRQDLWQVKTMVEKLPYALHFPDWVFAAQYFCKERMTR